MVNKEREHLEFETWRGTEVLAKDQVDWRRQSDSSILLKERRER